MQIQEGEGGSCRDPGWGRNKTYNNTKYLLLSSSLPRLTIGNKLFLSDRGEERRGEDC